MAAGDGIGVIYLWEPNNNWKYSMVNSKSRAPIQAMAFSPDGKTLICSDRDNQIHVSDIHSKTQQKSSPPFKQGETVPVMQGTTLVIDVQRAPLVPVSQGTNASTFPAAQSSASSEKHK